MKAIKTNFSAVLKQWIRNIAKEIASYMGYLETMLKLKKLKIKISKITEILTN
jgi:hypothetical protein